MTDIIANFSENNPEQNANFGLNNNTATVNFSIDNPDVSADFNLENYDLNAETELTQDEINAILQLNVIGAMWGGIAGDIQNQTDLINLLNEKADIAYVDDEIQNTSDTINERIDNEVNTLNSEIVQKVGVINGSELIDISRTSDTITITSKTFEFEQGIAASTWIIQHNLNKKPNIDIVDSNGSVQMPNEIIYNNSNKITVLFLAAFAGKAFLN